MITTAPITTATISIIRGAMWPTELCIDMVHMQNEHPGNKPSPHFDIGPSPPIQRINMNATAEP